MKKISVLIAGDPGSGKTQIARLLEKHAKELLGQNDLEIEVRSSQANPGLMPGYHHEVTIKVFRQVEVESEWEMPF